MDLLLVVVVILEVVACRSSEAVENASAVAEETGVELGDWRRHTS